MTNKIMWNIYSKTKTNSWVLASQEESYNSAAESLQGILAKYDLPLTNYAILHETWAIDVLQTSANMQHLPNTTSRKINRIVVDNTYCIGQRRLILFASLDLVSDQIILLLEQYDYFRRTWNCAMLAPEDSNMRFDQQVNLCEYADSDLIEQASVVHGVYYDEETYELVIINFKAPGLSCPIENARIKFDIQIQRKL